MNKLNLSTAKAIALVEQARMSGIVGVVVSLLLAALLFVLARRAYRMFAEEDGKKPVDRDTARLLLGGSTCIVFSTTILALVIYSLTLADRIVSPELYVLERMVQAL